MTRSHFATTEWSLVLAAGANAPEAGEALERLCSIYWYPVFAFVRRRGYDLAQAEDLTQGFFARMIEKGDLADADRNRGRFRSFLLTSCDHFLSNERDRAAAVKRGGGRVPVSIDAAVAENRYQRALVEAESPEHLYDRQWCLTLLDRVLDAVKADYAAAGKERLFERLAGFLTTDGVGGSHADAARDLDMSPAAVKVAVHRMRRRYREALRRHIGATLASPDDIDAEIRYLFRTLSAPV